MWRCLQFSYLPSWRSNLKKETVDSLIDTVWIYLLQIFEVKRRLHPAPLHCRGWNPVIFLCSVGSFGNKWGWNEWGAWAGFRDTTPTHPLIAIGFCSVYSSSPFCSSIICRAVKSCIRSDARCWCQPRAILAFSCSCQFCISHNEQVCCHFGQTFKHLRIKLLGQLREDWLVEMSASPTRCNPVKRRVRLSGDSHSSKYMCSEVMLYQCGFTLQTMLCQSQQNASYRWVSPE